MQHNDALHQVHVESFIASTEALHRRFGAVMPVEQWLDVAYEAQRAYSRSYLLAVGDDPQVADVVAERAYADAERALARRICIECGALSATGKSLCALCAEDVID